MTGRVDGQLRALLRVDLAASIGGPWTEIEAWVDTAFNGGLTLPHSMATKLGLSPGATTEAQLADGSRVTLGAIGPIEPFQMTIVSHQVVATDGAFPLLGTQLLAGRRLEIDYATGVIDLT